MPMRVGWRWRAGPQKIFRLGVILSGVGGHFRARLLSAALLWEARKTRLKDGKNSADKPDQKRRKSTHFVPVRKPPGKPLSNGVNRVLGGVTHRVGCQLI